MKRLFAFLLCLVLPILCACGVEQGNKSDTVPTLAEGSHNAGETPYIRTQSTADAQSIERLKANAANDDIMTAEEFMEFAFAGVGKLYFKENELDAFRALDQTAEYTFYVQDYFGAKTDERLDRYNEMTSLQSDLMHEYQLAELGDTPEGDHDFDRSAYVITDSLFTNEDALSRLPREWFENERMVAEYFNTEYDYVRIIAIYNVYVMQTAKMFADLGCKAEVRRCNTDSVGETASSDICFVTTTPEHLWEISDKVEPLCLVEDVSDALRERYDNITWTSEG